MKRTFFVLHRKVHDVESFKKSFVIKNSLDGVNLIWDDKTPEILIATEQVYTDASQWKKFKRLYGKSKITVFYTIEALSVDFNLFDIGITYDNTIESERYCQVLPPEDYYVSWLSKSSNDILSEEQAAALLPKKKFCNFLYSNWNAHPFRDNLFYELSKYKHVDSLGRHLNNVGKKGTGYIGHSSEVVGIKSAYKFTIACENAKFSGYTTEKMLSSLEAHTVPIYFGNKDAVKDVNPECFINCFDFETLEDIVNKVREIDENDNIWCYMISRPWYKAEHLEEKERRRNMYYNMIRRIFTEDLQSLSYKGDGTAIYGYKDFFYRHKIKNRWLKLLRAQVIKLLKKNL